MRGSTCNYFVKTGIFRLFRHGWPLPAISRYFLRKVIYFVRQSLAMARGNDSLFLKNISGRIGKQVVIKQYADKIVIAAYPGKPHRGRPKTELKKVYESRFKEAVKHARRIIANPVLKAEYQAKLPPGKRVFNFAIQEYLLLEKNQKQQ